MIHFFANHPTASNILMVVLFVVGIAVLPTMKRETMPEINKFEVQVSVVYPAASAADIEESICQSLEDATDGISFIDEKRCESKDNIGIMVLKMLEHGNMQQFIDDVNLAIDSIDDFPDEIEPPIIKELGRTTPVVSIAISTPVNKSALKTIAENYKQRLLQLPEIPIVVIKGFSTRQLKISVPDYNLRRFGLSINDLARLIDQQDIDLPVGDIESQKGNHQIRFTDQRRTPEELAELIVLSGTEGAEVRLGDIAVISDSFEYKEDKIDFNGNAAAILEIHKNTLDDSLKVFEAVQRFVKMEKQHLPETGTSLTITQDRASIVIDRLQLIIKNSWQGLILVTSAMYLFFSFRYTFWVVMGLPVSFLGSFFLFTYLGISINMLSLVGLLIAIGILMDDAIVISESIASEHRKGKSPLEAAVDGTKRVARGVLSSFFTTMLIFGGLLSLKGDIGQVLRVVPIVLMSVLVVSLVEAFLILPHHLKNALEHGENNEQTMHRWKKVFTDKFNHWRENIGQLADNAVEYRYAVAGATIAFFIISVSMIPTGVLKFKAFPDLDGDIIQAQILLPQGSSLTQTENVVATVIEGLKNTDQKLLPIEKESLIRNINIAYNQNHDAFEKGQHVATISVDLRSAEQRKSTLETFRRIWRQEVGELPSVISIQYKQPALGPAGRALHIRLTSNNLQELSSASYELQEWLNGYPGVVDVMDDLRPGKPQMTVKMKPGALTAGIDAKTIASQLRAAYQGIKIDNIQHNNESYEVQVILNDQSKNSLADFDYMPIIHPKTKQSVPITAIANVSEDRSYARINRINNLRTVSVYGDIDSDLANTSEILEDTKLKFLAKLNGNYPNVIVSFEGEMKNAAITGQSLRKAFLLGATGIFLLLSLQFRNYFEPIIVMIAIPLSFIGVIWGHLIMGLELTMPSMLGFVSLAGIVVNDSILLVEFVKQNIKEGMSVHSAASQATRDRFRAIILTSFTTIAGVTPLLFESSLQAQILIPLVTSIAFGIAMSTLLILIVLPVLYAILEDFGFTELDNQ